MLFRLTTCNPFRVRRHDSRAGRTRTGWHRTAAWPREKSGGCKVQDSHLVFLCIIFAIYRVPVVSRLFSTNHVCRLPTAPSSVLHVRSYGSSAETAKDSRTKRRLLAAAGLALVTLALVAVGVTRSQATPVEHSSPAVMMAQNLKTSMLSQTKVNSLSATVISCTSLFVITALAC